MMRDISGLDMADQQCHHSRTAEIPVILMSESRLPDTGTRVAAVIPKPFAFDELLHLVHQFWFQ
jgi:CheY-like chemotaxis protein